MYWLKVFWPVKRFAPLLTVALCRDKVDWITSIAALQFSVEFLIVGKKYAPKGYYAWEYMQNGYAN